MIQGLYSAATGIVAIEARQAAVANNIANASTVGFKRQNPVQEGFYNYFVTKLKRPFHFNVVSGPGGGAKVVETFSDLSGGIMRKTGDPLNVALQGPGYLVVDTPGGERFTRAGALAIDVDGHLATSDGYKVQNVGGGWIDARGGPVTIDSEGAVSVDGVMMGQMRLVEFEDAHMLTREGYTLLAASDAAMRRSARAANTQVVQEQLEMSNVNLSREMVEMIMGLRAYAANQRVINSVDETMSRLIDQVGSPV